VATPPLSSPSEIFAQPLWSARLAEWRQTTHASEWSALRATRDAARPDLVALLRAFRDGGGDGGPTGALDLEAFRTEFDAKTRGPWREFGLKGASGAMFVNMLSRNVPDRDAVTSALRAALQPPADVEEASARIRGLGDWLEAGIQADDFSRGSVHPRRSVTFLTTCWAAEDPGFPAYWRSAIELFTQASTYRQASDRATSYREYHRVYTDLMGILDVDAVDLEGFCAWWSHERMASTSGSGAGGESSGPSKGNGSKGQGSEEKGGAVVTGVPDTPRVWLISPGRGARYWDQWQADGVAAIGWDYLGDLGVYETRDALGDRIREERGDGVNPYNDINATWAFSRTMRPGDVIFAKRGRRRVVGVGVVSGPYRFDAQREGGCHVCDVDWRHAGDWSTGDGYLITKTLTEVTQYPEFVAGLATLAGTTLSELTDGVVDADDPPTGPDVPAYTLEMALSGLFVEPEQLTEMLSLLRRRRNLVLQGPPGTGKTYVASRLARVLIGANIPDQIERVQFHQSMSYEDFVQGFRPTDAGGFARKDGPFLRFCHAARQDPGSPYVLLIDEINRGNLSRILGELMLLIEHDKRGPEWAVTLTYAKDTEPAFHVPDNVYIIGTMNTADRSLALVDYALRRRFAFVDIGSAVHTERFREWLEGEGLSADLAGPLLTALADLNQRIRKDANLGPGFCVGHSYFCNVPKEPGAEWVQQVIRTEILPLIREYWVDDRERLLSAEETLDLGD
jgi:MoxR-like ATPase